MSRIEIAFMPKAGGWAWRCWSCDRNNLGYGEDREKAAREASQHERRTHAPASTPDTGSTP